MQSKRPAAGLDREDKHAHRPGTDWALRYNGLGEDRCELC